MKITRRHVLALTAAAAASAGGGVGLVATRWWDQPAGAGFRVLSTEEATFVSALAAAAWPATEAVALDGGAAGLDHFLDELLAVSPQIPRDLLRTLFHALDLWPVPTRGARFTSLRAADRDAVFMGWIDSELAEVRSAVQGVVLLLGMGYSTHPDVVSFMSPMFGCGFGR